jgi:hypothetical protein
MQNRDLLWVNGPNRQFEAAAEAVVAPTFTRGGRAASASASAVKPYEAFYLMEPDSVPWRSGWLTALLEEVGRGSPPPPLSPEDSGGMFADP